MVSHGIEEKASEPLKAQLKRIVAMLTRLIVPRGYRAEAPAPYGIDYDYEHEHRFAEHE